MKTQAEIEAYYRRLEGHTKQPGAAQGGTVRLESIGDHLKAGAEPLWEQGRQIDKILEAMYEGLARIVADAVRYYEPHGWGIHRFPDVTEHLPECFLVYFQDWLPPGGIASQDRQAIHDHHFRAWLFREGWELLSSHWITGQVGGVDGELGNLVPYTSVFLINAEEAERPRIADAYLACLRGWRSETAHTATLTQLIEELEVARVVLGGDTPVRLGDGNPIARLSLDRQAGGILLESGKAA